MSALESEKKGARLRIPIAVLAIASSIGIAGAVELLQSEAAGPPVPPVVAQAESQRAQEDDVDDDRGLRARTQPTRWDRGALRQFRTVTDRAAARAKSIAGRAERRAYDGAPPVIPHTSNFGGTAFQCIDCHAGGTELGERVAHPMSHPPLANCTQCHIESANSQFTPGPDPANTFVGRPSPGPGPRAGEFAPPRIPHSISMRGNCLSCHGEFGYPGLRTEHPLRANCMQCHVAKDGGV